MSGLIVPSIAVYAKEIAKIIAERAREGDFWEFTGADETEDGTVAGCSCFQPRLHDPRGLAVLRRADGTRVLTMTRTNYEAWQAHGKREQP